MTEKATAQPAPAADNGRHYKARAAEEYAAAMTAGLTEQQATARIACRYFVSEQTLAAWLSDAGHAEKK